jgi:hypothetical protein
MGVSPPARASAEIGVDHIQSSLQIVRGRQDENCKEKAARTALASRVGRDLTDLEWGRARARMLEFVMILRAWERRTVASEAEVEKAAA